MLCNLNQTKRNVLWPKAKSFVSKFSLSCFYLLVFLFIKLESRSYLFQYLDNDVLAFLGLYLLPWIKSNALFLPLDPSYRPYLRAISIKCSLLSIGSHIICPGFPSFPALWTFMWCLCLIWYTRKHFGLSCIDQSAFDSYFWVSGSPLCEWTVSADIFEVPISRWLRWLNC